MTRQADVRRVLAEPCFSRARATRGEGPRINRTTTLPDSILAPRTLPVRWRDDIPTPASTPASTEE